MAATAWKRVAVGDRGVVVGPCEDAAEKAPHKRCRVRFDDGKGTYVYTKGQQARRAPLAGQHVLGDGVIARAAVRNKCAAGDRGVVVGRGRRGGLTVKWAPSGATCDVAVADVAPAPVVAAPGAPRILKGDVVVASVDYETVKVGDRGVVVGPCSDPAMSRADLRVLVDFDGKAAYNYRCDTQIQLAPLLDGATFVRDDTVVARGARGASSWAWGPTGGRCASRRTTAWRTSRRRTWRTRRSWPTRPSSARARASSRASATTRSGRATAASSWAPATC